MTDPANANCAWLLPESGHKAPGPKSVQKCREQANAAHEAAAQAAAHSRNI